MAEEIKAPLHHVWPDAEGASVCKKCNAQPRLYLIPAGFAWVGCPCTQTEAKACTVDECFNDWEKINDQN